MPLSASVDCRSLTPGASGRISQTHSGTQSKTGQLQTGFSGQFPPDWVDNLARIQWTDSSGFGGQFGPDYAHMIPSRKSSRPSRTMFLYSSGQVVCDAGIQNSVVWICQDVDEVLVIHVPAPVSGGLPRHCVARNVRQ